MVAQFFSPTVNKGRLVMHTSLRWFLGLSLALTLSACGSDDSGEGEDLPEVDCSGDVPTFGEVTAFTTVCNDCHSTTLSGEARNDAPADINWDDYDSASEHAEKGVEEVFEGEMPPEDSTETLTEAQKEDFYKWGLCGTPE
jgi:hypothetical protein